MEVATLQNEIRKLLRERNAILIVHYYEREEIQEIADILGDSLALSIEAARTDAEVIVFAGVHFMAESAAIVSPEKTVLLPRLDAGCPLADMITPEQLAQARKETSGRRRRGLRQLNRGDQGPKRHLLHLGQRGQGRKFPGGMQGSPDDPGRQSRPVHGGIHRQEDHPLERLLPGAPFPDAGRGRADEGPSPRRPFRRPSGVPDRGSPDGGFRGKHGGDHPLCGEILRRGRSSWGRRRG